MKAVLRLTAACLLLITIDMGGSEAQFHWQWRKMNSNFWQGPILRQMKIKNDDRVAIVEAVAASFKLDKEVPNDIGDAQLYDIASNESYEWVDLDRDGVPELVTQAFGIDFCGAVGNCALQVFRQSGHKFDLVLRSSAESLMVDRSGTQPLLVLYTHGSASEGELTVYGFPRKGAAKPLYHYDVQWAPPNGIGVAYSHPHLTMLPLTD
jgi:hypothetical protein